MKYIKRLVDDDLGERLKSAGAVLVRGPKACGKTETAKQQAKSTLRTDIDPKVEAMMSFDPGQLLLGDTPRLIDEWQRQPRLWDYVRHAVDDRKKPGQFILTGSANPDDDIPLHSGSGRFSIIDMRTLSWQELGYSSGSVSLGALLRGESIQGEITEISLNDILDRLCVGGWPQNLGVDKKLAMHNNRDYVSLLVNIDMSRVGNRKRDPVKVRALLKSLARNVATNVELQTLAEDTRLETDNFARSTVDDYMDALRRLMIVEEQSAFNLHIRSTAELRKTPKRHLADPSLAVSLLRLDNEKLLNDPRYLGFLFESLAIHDLFVYASFNDASVYFHRDSNGNEVDAIVENEAGDWAAFEVKLGGDNYDEAAKKLLDFRDNVDMVKTARPSSLNIITGVGTTYTRPDGVNVISLSSLGK